MDDDDDVMMDDDMFRQTLLNFTCQLMKKDEKPRDATTLPQTALTSNKTAAISASASKTAINSTVTTTIYENISPTVATSKANISKGSGLSTVASSIPWSAGDSSTKTRGPIETISVEALRVLGNVGSLYSGGPTPKTVAAIRTNQPCHANSLSESEQQLIQILQRPLVQPSKGQRTKSPTTEAVISNQPVPNNSLSESDHELIKILQQPLLHLPKGRHSKEKLRSQHVAPTARAPNVSTFATKPHHSGPQRMDQTSGESLAQAPMATVNSFDAAGNIVYQMNISLPAWNSQTVSTNQMPTVDFKTSYNNLVAVDSTSCLPVNPQGILKSSLTGPVTSVMQSSSITKYPLIRNALLGGSNINPGLSSSSLSESIISTGLSEAAESRSGPDNLLDNKFKEQQHLASFKVHLRYPSVTNWNDKTPYTCHCFDLGSLWVATENDQFQECIKRTHSLPTCFKHTDPSRKSHDTVVFTVDNAGLVVVKPGTVTHVMKLIRTRTSIFLQDGALVRVSKFFEIQSKQRLVAKVELTDHSSPFLTMFGLNFPEDYLYLNDLGELQKTPVVILDDAEDNSISVPEGTTSNTSATVQGSSLSSVGAFHNLQPSVMCSESISQSTFNRYPDPTSLPINFFNSTNPVARIITDQGSILQGSSNASAKNSSADDQNEISVIEVCPKLKDEVSLKTDKYQALDEAHLANLLFCKNCGWHFDFVMEWVVHFNVVPQCLKAIKFGFSEEIKLSKILKLYASRVVSSKLNFTCLECNKDFDCPLDYALHRDQHISDVKFICPDCTGLFKSPYSFYWHSCFNVKEIMHLNKPVPPGLSAKQVLKIYRQLPPEQVACLLTCPICEKNFSYASFFVNHLKIVPNCFVGLSKLHKKDKNTFYLDVYFENQKNIPRKVIECDQCTATLNSAWAFLLHKDHHSVSQINALITCKSCQKGFLSPCTFYKHTCKSEQPLSWCFYCCKIALAASKNPTTITPPEIITLSEDNPISTTTKFVETAVVSKPSAAKTFTTLPDTSVTSVSTATMTPSIPSLAANPETNMSSLSSKTSTFPTSSKAENVSNTLKCVPPTHKQLETSNAHPSITVSTLAEPFPQLKSATVSAKKFCFETQPAVGHEPDERNILHRQIVPEQISDLNVHPSAELENLPAFNIDDCYLCLDCNQKLLFDSEQLSDHCEHFPDHVNINPLCAYNSFSISLPKIDFAENDGAAKAEKRNFDSNQICMDQPPLKMKLCRAQSGEFKLNS